LADISTTGNAALGSVHAAERNALAQAAGILPNNTLNLLSSIAKIASAGSGSRLFDLFSPRGGGADAGLFR